MNYFFLWLSKCIPFNCYCYGNDVVKRKEYHSQMHKWSNEQDALWSQENYHFFFYKIFKVTNIDRFLCHFSSCSTKKKYHGLTAALITIIMKRHCISNLNNVLHVIPWYDPDLANNIFLKRHITDSKKNTNPYLLLFFF